MQAKQNLRLALKAYRDGNFADAGAMFAAAAESEDIEEFLDLDAEPDLDILEDTEEETSISASSPPRRKGNRLRIARLLSSSMEAVASDSEIVENFVEDDEEEFLEPDPDLIGEGNIPASFSSDKNFSSVIKFRG